MSAETEYWECSRRFCRWVGTDEEKKLRRETGRPLVTYTLVCPSCGSDSFYREKPLFIPLLTCYYDAFDRGEKSEEYRPVNSRWNLDRCRIGRRVVLSRGYGKKHRRTDLGWISEVEFRAIVVRWQRELDRIDGRLTLCDQFGGEAEGATGLRV